MSHRVLIGNAVLPICVVLFATMAARSAETRLTEDVNFNRDIRPILADACLHCHGPADDTREADLRLDVRDNALADRGGYHVISVEDPNESELLQRITGDDPDTRMPPAESGKPPLTPEQIALIRSWIEQGAPWEEHWAFERLESPEVPAIKAADKWARNPIDFFVFAKIQTAKLAPSDEADRYVLARRVALDLTGIPAEREQIEEFVNDESPDAYERFVKKLLDSPAYGEHQARFWLDAARYGDTHGMHFDNYREIWPYRDWVIDAFNRNMPYDDFIVEQLAGDLLPNPTRKQRIATGFNRCNITSSEAGAIKEELATQYVIDRVGTFGTVFLGLTVGCAQCHDHKFDPISQKEFYELYAFFNNTVGPAMDGNRQDTPPIVVVPDASHRDQLEACERREAELAAELTEHRQRIAADFARWCDQWKVRDAAAECPTPVSDDGLVFWLPLDEGQGSKAQAKVAGKRVAIVLPSSAKWTADSPLGAAIEFTKDEPLVIEGGADLDVDQPFTLSFWLRSPATVVDGTIFEKRDPTGNQAGWTMVFDSRYDLTLRLVATNGTDELRALAADGPLTSGKWSHLCIRYAGTRAVESCQIHVDGKLADLRIFDHRRIKGLIQSKQPLSIGSKLSGGAIGDIRLYERLLCDEEARLLANTPEVRAELRKLAEPAPGSPGPNDLALDYYCNVHDATYQTLSRARIANYVELDRIRIASPTSLVMQERTDQTPTAHILFRGDYSQKRDVVASKVPEVFPPLPAGERADRLGLARWLTADSHPLTARVAVNRIWQSLFGTGIVKTAEDFGTRGEPPTHPELLDWLSAEFVRSGWDVKHLIELIVTSSTYRQSSDRTAAQLEIDPENRLLSSAPRYRLDAEVLRDEVLFMSGLLVRKVGGPSVKPYQPPGVWEAVAFEGSNTEKYQQESGPALHRRSLYTFWKRTAPPAAMAVFNAPNREMCTVRRERTNTPLQALALMNDPQMVEAARVLAEKAVAAESNVDARLLWMGRQVTGKPLSQDDAVLLQGALGEFQEHFEKSQAAAQALISVGETPVDSTLAPAEVAAWTMVANTLLNRDDVISKE